MSRAASKLAKVRSDRDALFDAGKYYEALQLYKTLFSRTIVKKGWDEAKEIATEGASGLLQQGRSNEGGELALMILQVYAKAQQQCNETEASKKQTARWMVEVVAESWKVSYSAIIDGLNIPMIFSSFSLAFSGRLLKLCALFPNDAEGLQAKIAFLKAAIKWVK